GASTTGQQIVAGNAPYDAAQSLAESETLDFLDVLQSDLQIISSAHWPARFGYPNDWKIPRDAWNSTEPLLAEIPLPEGKGIGLVAIRRVQGEYVVGGRRLTPEFLKSLGIAPGMRAVLWLASDEVIDAQGALADRDKIARLAERSMVGRAEGVVQWSDHRPND